MSEQADKKEVDALQNNDGPDLWEVARTLANAEGGFVGMIFDPQSYAIDEEYWKQFFLWPPWCLWTKAL